MRPSPVGTAENSPGRQSWVTFTYSAAWDLRLFLGDVAAEALAQLFRDAVLQDASLGHSNLCQVDRRRGGDGYQYPNQQRRQQSGNCPCLQAQYDRHLPETQIHQLPLLQGVYPMNHCQRQKESCNRNRAQANQNYVNGAMQPLPRTAMRTLYQVLLVIAAHLRSNAGDVI